MESNSTRRIGSDQVTFARCANTVDLPAPLAPVRENSIRKDYVGARIAGMPSLRAARVAGYGGCMWDDDVETYAEVRAAELALLSTEVRRDVARLDSLLSPDFAEIGASGRRWSRDDTMSALADEDARAMPPTSDWLFNELSPGIVLVNYLIESPERPSRRSSLWQVTQDGPVLRFHQGTVVASELAASDSGAS